MPLSNFLQTAEFKDDDPFPTRKYASFQDIEYECTSSQVADDGLFDIIRV